MKPRRFAHLDLGGGSRLLYCRDFLDASDAQKSLDCLNGIVPWVRPCLTIYGRSCQQPRDTCYVADEGLPLYKYSNYQPVVYKWDEFPALKLVADAVHDALPECIFNSVLMNRYANGADYVGWHSDDERVYGSTPTIASVSLGKEREFLIRKKRSRRVVQESKEIRGCTDLGTSQASESIGERKGNRTGKTSRSEVTSAFDVLLGKSSKFNNFDGMGRKLGASISEATPANAITGIKASKDMHSFLLKHGSLLVMEGYTQRDWEHSVPRRKRADGLRINLTFRYIIGTELRK